MITRMLATCCLLALAACGGSDKPDETTTSASTLAAPNPSADLEAAVRNYSSAFLTGDGAAAYALLSERCQDATPLSDFAAITEQAADTYGEVAIKSLKVKVDGDKGTATYTYPVATLNQSEQSWVNEDGWKWDAC